MTTCFLMAAYIGPTKSMHCPKCDGSDIMETGATDKELREGQQSLCMLQTTRDIFPGMQTSDILEKLIEKMEEDVVERQNWQQKIKK